MTSSNLIGCSTGRSLGFAPFKILPNVENHVGGQLVDGGSNGKEAIRPVPAGPRPQVNPPAFLALVEILDDRVGWHLNGWAGGIEAEARARQ